MDIKVSRAFLDKHTMLSGTARKVFAGDAMWYILQSLQRRPRTSVNDMMEWNRRPMDEAFMNTIYDIELKYIRPDSRRFTAMRDTAVPEPPSVPEGSSVAVGAGGDHTIAGDAGDAGDVGDAGDAGDAPINRAGHLETLRILRDRLNELLLDETMWSGASTKNGQTQMSGKRFETLIQTCLEEKGISFTRASSQQSYDFRDVGEDKLWFDVKKTDSNNIMLNDTLPKRGTWYVIFSTKQRKIVMVPAEQWLDDERNAGIFAYYEKVMEMRKLYKRFGDFSVCTRANMTINARSVLERCQTNKCVILE